MKTTCTKIFPSVPFAHRAPNHDGHCALIHGHGWVLEVTFCAITKDENGFVFDFGKCGPLKAFIANFDHALVLNDTDPQLRHIEAALLPNGLPPLAKIVTVPDCSCEGLAEYFGNHFDKIVAQVTNGRARVAGVKLWEDEKNFAISDRYGFAL